MSGRFLCGTLGRTTFPSAVVSFTIAILVACIYGMSSVGVPIGMVGVAAGTNGYSDTYGRSTCHALSSVSADGGIVGRGVLPLVYDSLEIMLPSYTRSDRNRLAHFL